jgi:hypothetical protein
MKEDVIEIVTKTLTKLFHTENKSEIVNSSIYITEIVTKAIAAGGSVEIRDKEGKSRELVIPGVSRLI